MMKPRGKTNAFSIGSGTPVLTIPQEVAEDFEMDVKSKKTFFDIYTDISKNKKRIIYEFSYHVPKEEKNE